MEAKATSSVESFLSNKEEEKVKVQIQTNSTSVSSMSDSHNAFPYNIEKQLTTFYYKFLVRLKGKTAKI